MVSFSLTSFYPNPPKPNRRFSAPSKHKYSHSQNQFPMAKSASSTSSLSSSSPSLSSERALPKPAFVANLRPTFDTAQLFSVFLFIVWCGANSLYATDAHSLLHDSSHEHLYVELTLFQILVSAAIVFPFVPRPYIAATIGNRSTYISACHFLGAVLSNSSYAILGATSTLVWKLSEPFATVIFKITIQKERVLPLRITGIGIVVIGVLTFSGFNLSNSLMFSPIVLANIAFPLRNVLMKLTQANRYGSAGSITNKLPYNPQRAFLNMQLHALPFALCALLLKWCIAPTIPISVIPYLIRNSLYFSIYQMASIALLARLDSLTHAVANLFKRFSSIFITALFIRTGDILPQHIVGIMLTFIGFPLYALSGFIDAHTKLKTRLTLVGKPFLSVIVGTVLFIAGFSSRPTIEDSYSAYQSIHQTPPRYIRTSAKIPDWVRHPRELFPTEDSVERTLQTLAQIDNPIKKNRRDHVVYQTYDFDIRHMSNDNYGNNIWLTAAMNILPAFSEKRVCRSVDRGVCERMHPDVCASYTRQCMKEQPVADERTRLMFYYPTANAFDKANVGQFGTEVNSMEKYDDIMLVIGVGIQEYFTPNNTFCGINHRGRVETKPENFRFTDNGLRVLAAHEKRKLPITFRGDFTYRAAKKAGYNYGISLGCPSLMLNPDPDAGQALAVKYSALKDRIGDRTLKIAVNIKNECAGFLPVFKRILQDYPNAVVFAQHRAEVEHAGKVGFPPDRVRGFVDVAEWKQAMSEMDVSIGVRIHGNMLALAAGVPAFVIATDHRVLELTERMLLPHTNSFDNRLVEGVDVARLVSSFNFDANAYDQNRCETAATYHRLFARYDLPTSDHVNYIGRRCL